MTNFDDQNIFNSWKDTLLMDEWIKEGIAHEMALIVQIKQWFHIK